MAGHRQHSKWEWTKLAKRRTAIGRSNDEPCSSCGMPIDYTLSGNHREGPTVDHPDILAFGGELLPPLDHLRMMHRRCASRQGGKVKAATTKSKSNRTPRRSLIEGSRPLPVAPGMLSPEPPIGSGLAAADRLLLAGCTGGMPRHFTGSHPSAVRSLFDEVQEAWVRDVMKINLRPWQRAVLIRAFEVDADGNLCWRVIIVSVGRQSGKTWLIRAITNLRQRLFAPVEPQSILHVARIREAARMVIVNEQFARWAKGHGIVVRSSNGQEAWIWPDDSRWDLSSLDGAYGRSAGLALLDETWDIRRNQYFEGIQPVTAAREQAQTWIISAAHREATELVPLMMERALAGREGYFLADWGARPDDDLNDPAVWQRMGPHWDRNREIAVAEAVGEESFREQWANIWPDVLGKKAAEASPFANWASLPKVDRPEPPRGLLVALDEHYDASGAAVAAFDGTSYWYREVPGVREAVALASQWTDGEILVGFSLRHLVRSMGVRHPVPYGAKETAQGLPLLMESVKSGAITHEHSETLANQATGARVRIGETGTMTLSVKGSANNVTGMKLAAWLVKHEREQIHEAAAIW